MRPVIGSSCALRGLEHNVYDVNFRNLALWYRERA
jgi:hypothetical protein